MNATCDRTPKITPTTDADMTMCEAEQFIASVPWRAVKNVTTNHYLEINGWCYWFIRPNMLNRERAEDRKHEPIPD